MRKRPAWSTPLLALLLPGVACQAPAEPEEVLPVTFDFGIHRLQTEPAFVIDARTDLVRVRGHLLTPCLPYGASASAEAVGRTLVLHVVGEAPGDCPRDAVTSVGYQAVVSTAAGRLEQLRVVHQWRDAAWPADTVLSHALPG